MECKVFIHTNKKQYLGALIGKYTIERYSNHLDKFKVEIIIAEEVEELQKLFGKKIHKDGQLQVYDDGDLQSFTLTRFMPPELMNYTGRSIVVDPDVFSVYSDIWDLFQMDMGGNAILMRRQKADQWATSVMLLDNEQLKHWKISHIVDQLINQEMDYRVQMGLTKETVSIGILGHEWNSFDILNDNTKLLHNTVRITQPWRAGLRIDYTPKKMKPVFGIIPRKWIHTIVGKNPNYHREHPDQRQTDFFFGHLKSAINKGVLPMDTVENEIHNGHLRKDAMEVLDKTKEI